jgi:hypothetical protein
MTTKVCIMLTALITGIASGVMAQSQQDKIMRTAVLETRVIRDASGCPTALDLWLASTSDTIQGLEVILQWDRPNHPEFVRGKTGSGKQPSKADSLTALLKPTDPSTQIPIDRLETLISGWEFVEARSVDGNFAKILAVAKLLGQEEPAPILPGASGSLMRIPLSNAPAVPDMVDSTSAQISFDPAGTRLSTHRGALFGPLTLRSTAVDTRDCIKGDISK